MQTNLKFGMLQTIYTGEEETKTRTIKVPGEDGKEIEQVEQYSVFKPVRCADPKCGRTISHNAPCFIDATTGSVWCDDCGKCERYARKKAAQREERAKQRKAVEEATSK